ncbi:hypothetical protein [Stenomitos frigidus]|nr:hypothetical protein [Stenomitos frigidus]
MATPVVSYVSGAVNDDRDTDSVSRGFAFSYSETDDVALKPIPTADSVL